MKKHVWQNTSEFSKLLSPYSFTSMLTNLPRSLLTFKYNYIFQGIDLCRDWFHKKFDSKVCVNNLLGTKIHIRYKKEKKKGQAGSTKHKIDSLVPHWPPNVFDLLQRLYSSVAFYVGKCCYIRKSLVWMIKICLFQPSYHCCLTLLLGCKPWWTTHCREEYRSLETETLTYE